VERSTSASSDPSCDAAASPDAAPPSASATRNDGGNVASSCPWPLPATRQTRDRRVSRSMQITVSAERRGEHAEYPLIPVTMFRPAEPTRHVVQRGPKCVRNCSQRLALEVQP